jgi:hypothetical protein
MNLDELNKIVRKKPIFNFLSSYAYMLSFEVGKPFLKIKTMNKKNSIFKKMKEYIFEQEYYSVAVRGEISFFFVEYWKLKKGNRIICDADYDHDEIEKIMSFALSGHSISKISIITGTKKYVVIAFSNGMVLTTSGNKKDDLAIFINKMKILEINPYKGIRYYNIDEWQDAKWMEQY